MGRRYCRYRLRSSLGVIVHSSSAEQFSSTCLALRWVLKNEWPNHTSVTLIPVSICVCLSPPCTNRPHGSPPITGLQTGVYSATLGARFWTTVVSTEICVQIAYLVQTEQPPHLIQSSRRQCPLAARASNTPFLSDSTVLWKQLWNE